MTDRPTRPGPDIDPVEASRLSDTGEVVLLDVREADEWAAGRASSATHMPLGELRPDALPPGARVVTVCRSGGRSAQAAAGLALAGVQAQNMAGGMKAWAKAGLPVTADGGRPGTIA